jgi:phosphoribosylglycinamide formyltransferase 1
VSARLVVLVSGAGTNLQALLDACADPDYGARIVAVGADRDGIEGLARAERSGVPTFVVRLKDHPSRDSWDAALSDSVAAYRPDLVVLAGFMKILGKRFLDRHAERVVNTHPALLPAFPGAHPVRDALDHGVRVTGCTVHLVDSGVDTGPIVAQQAVPVLPDDDEDSLHERIKAAERPLLARTVGHLVRDGWSIERRKVRIGERGIGDNPHRGRRNEQGGPGDPHRD